MKKNYLDVHTQMAIAEHGEDHHKVKLLSEHQVHPKALSVALKTSIDMGDDYVLGHVLRHQLSKRDQTKVIDRGTPETLMQMIRHQPKIHHGFIQNFNNPSSVKYLEMLKQHHPNYKNAADKRIKELTRFHQP